MHVHIVSFDDLFHFVPTILLARGECTCGRESRWLVAIVWLHFACCVHF